MKLPSINAVERFHRCLMGWFHENARTFFWRNKDATTYQQVVSEVLLQRTTATAVARFLPAFLDRYPSWEAIAGSDEEELGDTLRPLGLWRRRATSLLQLAQVMVKLKDGLPTTREKVELLPGIGQYIASAILIIHHGHPEPLLDTNMARLLERYFGPRKLVDIRYDPYLQALARMVVAQGEPKETNWAILDHAALVCRLRNPICPSCALRSECRFAQGH